MGAISWPSIGWYCIFSTFVYYQQLHGKEFRGSSVVFGLVLNLFAFAGMLISFAYCIYYGWNVSWLGAIAAFIIGIFAMLPGMLVERIVGKLTLSLAGFVVCPLAAYMMFHYIPKS
jgi:uncharacterized membrane protein